MPNRSKVVRSGILSVFLFGALLFGCTTGDVGDGPSPPSGEDDPVAEETGLKDLDPQYANIIDQYVLARLDRLDIEPHWASESELIRRMAFDLSGGPPTDADMTTLAGAAAEQIADHFMAKPGFIMVSQIIYADIFLFSNDEMYSRVDQIRSLNDLVASLHTGAIGHDTFVKQVLQHPAFLSRFTSAADRATASLSLFIGFEPVTPYDFRFGNMFNGYELTDEDNRVFTWTGVCDNPESDEIESCVATLWGMVGENAVDAGNMLVSLPAFAEHGAAMIFKRYIGAEVDQALPELAVALGSFFRNAGYNLKTLTREIVTSAAYRQSFNYRDDDLVAN